MRNLPYRLTCRIIEVPERIYCCYATETREERLFSWEKPRKMLRVRDTPTVNLLSQVKIAD